MLIFRKEFVPKFLYKGGNTVKIEPDFFIVNVASGEPSHDRYNILKNYDFPVLNRGDKYPTKQEVVQYLKKRGGSPTFVKYSNFQLLVYLSHLIDIDVFGFLFLICRLSGELLMLSEFRRNWMKVFWDLLIKF